MCHAFLKLFEYHPGGICQFFGWSSSTWFVVFFIFFCTNAWRGWENDLSQQNVSIFCQSFSWLVLFFVVLSTIMLEAGEKTTYPGRTSHFFAILLLGSSYSLWSSVLLCLRVTRERPIPAERLNFLPDFHLVRVLLGWSSSLFSSVLMLEEDERTTYPSRTSQFFARFSLGWSSSFSFSVLLCLRGARKWLIPVEHFKNWLLKNEVAQGKLWLQIIIPLRFSSRQNECACLDHFVNFRNFGTFPWHPCVAAKLDGWLGRLASFSKAPLLTTINCGAFNKEPFDFAVSAGLEDWSLGIYSSVIFSMEETSDVFNSLMGIVNSGGPVPVHCWSIIINCPEFHWHRFILVDTHRRWTIFSRRSGGPFMLDIKRYLSWAIYILTSGQLGRAYSGALL